MRENVTITHAVVSTLTLYVLTSERVRRLVIMLQSFADP
jgi:hypothetical protein